MKRGKKGDRHHRSVSADRNGSDLQKDREHLAGRLRRIFTPETHDEANGADRNGRVSNIKNRPDTKIQKIDHLPEVNAVHYISDSAAQNKGNAQRAPKP